VPLPNQTAKPARYRRVEGHADASTTVACGPATTRTSKPARGCPPVCRTEGLRDDHGDVTGSGLPRTAPPLPSTLRHRPHLRRRVARPCRPHPHTEPRRPRRPRHRLLHPRPCPVRRRHPRRTDPFDRTATTTDVAARVTDSSARINIDGANAITNHAASEADAISTVPDPDSPEGLATTLGIIADHQSKSAATVQQSAAAESALSQQAAASDTATTTGLDNDGQSCPAPTRGWHT
jgi:hypothetical protein